MSQSQRKITASLYVTLDGVFESPEQWHFPYHNEEFLQVLRDEAEASDTMLLGRRTYDAFASYWPHQGSEVPMADYMNNSTKLVLSTTLTDPQWQNTSVISGDVTSQLLDVKRQPGKNIAVPGSASVVSFLLGAGLLDELTLLQHPLIVGDDSRRVFGDLVERVPLELADVSRFATDVLRLKYLRAA